MNKENESGRVLRRIGIWLTVLLLALGLAKGANNRLEVTQYECISQALPQAYDGYKIVQLSDLHSKTFGTDNEPLLERLQVLQPDLIAVTGDVIDGMTHTDIDRSLRFMEQIAEIAPTYYVTGNHELMLDQGEFASFTEKIQEYGVTYLENETAVISKPDSGLTLSLIGMDDYSLQANLLGTLVEDAAGTFRILLAHEPQLLHDYYAPTGVELVLSGHAHGGQWRIPFLHRGLFAPDQGILPELTEGLVYDGDTAMVISRGLGNSTFPLRLCNHPEIVCVTLHTRGVS